MADQHRMPTHHPRIIGTRHMVASANYLAAQAGFEILEAGGNAIDAGVAGGIALGVLQCEYVHFAGVAPIMIHLAGDRRDGVDQRPWPVAEAGVAPHGSASTRAAASCPTSSARVVPAAPDAWITALERYGTMSFAEVAAAAIRFGREGFGFQSISHEIIVGSAPTRSAAGRRTRRSTCRTARPRSREQRFFQTDLANSHPVHGGSGELPPRARAAVRPA